MMFVLLISTKYLVYVSSVESSSLAVSYFYGLSAAGAGSSTVNSPTIFSTSLTSF